MAKTTSGADTQDLSSLSKEELIRLLNEKTASLEKAESDLKQEQEERAQAVLKLNKKLSKIKSKNALLKEQNQKIQTNNDNFVTIHDNLMLFIKEHRLESIDVLKDSNLPSVYEFSRVENFHYTVITNLINAIRTLHYHQTRSLNLGTSEKNRGELPVPPKDKESLSDEDREMENYGHSLESDATVTEDFDLSDEIRYDEPDDTVSDEQETASDEQHPVVKILSPKRFTASKEGNNTLLKLTSSVHQGQDVLEVLEQDKKALDGIHDPNYKNEGVTRRRRKRAQYTTNNVNELIGIFERDPEQKIILRCPCCRQPREFELDSKIERYNEVLVKGASVKDVKKALLPVYTGYCKTCGCTHEINPTVVQHFNFKHDPDSLVGKALNLSVTETSQGHTADVSETVSETSQRCEKCDLKGNAHISEISKETSKSLSENVSETSLNTDMQKIRRQNFNKLKHKENTLISKTDEFEMIDIGENEYVIEPWSFDANTYSLLPAFQKSKLSIGVLASASAIFCQMGVPKNKISTVYDGEGFPISRDQLTGGINCFARAFLSNVAKQIKKDILRTSESVLFDESSLLVMETKYKKLSEGKNSKKSVIWVMSSSWVSPIAACWYQVTPSRSHQTLLDLLEELDIRQHAKFMVSDGYSGYFKAARKLRKEKNIDIQNASCWCHGRRPLHKYLRDAGLLKIYNRYLLPDGALFSSFTDNLKKYQAEPKERILEDKERDLLIIYYLINALFVIDSSVVIEHGFELTNEAFKESLMKARSERSRSIVEAIFDAIKIFIARNPMIIKACYEDNKVTFVPNEFFAESKALLYLIRYEAELRVFLTDPSIELTQSSCERALKAAISVRRNCQKLQSEDGAHAFADFMTIAETCNQNSVPVQNYLVWLVANIKKRLYEYSLHHDLDSSAYCMPKRMQAEVEGRKTTLGIYDPACSYSYDLISVKGLMPYDYRKYLEEERKSA